MAQPVVQPIKVSEAPADVQALFVDIQDTMGAPWPPASWRALAMYPAVTRLFWERLKPAVATEAFLRSALEITERAYEAQRWYEPDYQPGVPEEARARIRWELDALDFGNPQLMIQEAALKRALEGEAVGRPGPTEPRRHPSPYRRPEIELIDEEHASPEIKRLYQDIKRTLGLPIVNSDYQAMAKWPGFFEPAWNDVKAWRRREEYTALKQALAEMADEAAGRLMPPVRIETHELEAALPDPAERENLRLTVQMFDRLLPGLVLNVALLRVGAAAGQPVFAPQPMGAVAP